MKTVEDRLIQMSKDVRWYQDNDLNKVTALVEAWNYRDAYELAAQLDREQGYYGADDVGYYKSEFHRLLAVICGEVYRIKNLTPHAINIVGENGEIVRVVEPEEKPARLKMSTERKGNALGIPLSMSVFGEPENLPAEEDGVLLIVSQLIKSALPVRRDLVVPAEIVRDEKGNIVGCKSLGL